jgi:ABC-type antimicrobial peptide transport system permease subunit
VPADENLQTAAESLRGFVRGASFQAALFTAFGGLALLLVAFGLFAVISHAVSQRTREMAIRLALGARPTQVRQLILAQGLRPAALGLVAGLSLSWIVTRSMTKSLYGVSPTDPATIVTMSALLAATTVAAILGPAARATRVNPVLALRQD